MCCITANGVRYPGLFIHPQSGIDGAGGEGLFVQVSGGSNGGLMGDALELNVLYHVEVDFTQSSWTVVVNGETLRDAVSKSSHTVTQNMQCWSGFPNHDAADVTITALSMTSKSTSFPTTSPSPNPTPSPHWPSMLKEVQLPLVPVYGAIVGYADILDDIHFEIDFTINSWPVGDWGNIFQCGTANGVRYPGLFIHPQSGIDGAGGEGLLVSVSGGSSGGLMGDALELNVLYHVEVDFTQSSWTVVVNGETLRDAVSKSSHTVTQNMQCWSGFPNHDAADVTITALSMTSKSTSFPTTSPSPNPTPSPH